MSLPLAMSCWSSEMSSSMPFHLDICTLEPLVTEDTLEPMKFLPARERVLTCSIDLGRKRCACGEWYVFVCKKERYFFLFLDNFSHPSNGGRGHVCFFFAAKMRWRERLLRPKKDTCSFSHKSLSEFNRVVRSSSSAKLSIAKSRRTHKRAQRMNTNVIDKNSRSLVKEARALSRSNRRNAFTIRY